MSEVDECVKFVISCHAIIIFRLDHVFCVCLDIYNGNELNNREPNCPFRYVFDNTSIN